MDRASFDEIRKRARGGDGAARRTLESLYVQIARSSMEAAGRSPLARLVRAQAKRIARERGLQLPKDQDEVLRQLAPYLAGLVLRPRQAGPSQAGPSQAGPSQAGPSQAGPSQVLVSGPPLPPETVVVSGNTIKRR